MSNRNTARATEVTNSGIFNEVEQMKYKVEKEHTYKKKEEHLYKEKKRNDSECVIKI